MRTPYMIRSAALTGYEQVARSVGLNPLAVLREVGIDPGCLVDPDIKIPADAVGRLYELAALESGVEDFGLRVAETRNLSNFGPIGLLAREEPTVRQALETIIRYLHLQNEAMSNTLEEAGSQVILGIQTAPGLHLRARQGVELSVGVMVQIIRGFLGEYWRPQLVCFEHALPRDTTYYRQFFHAPVEFNHDFSGLVCRANDLASPMPSSDPVLARYARKYLEEINIHRDAPMNEKVRQLVYVLMPSGRCTVEQVARHLGVDRRTVHRQLASTGDSFSSITTSVRRELADGYVASGDRSLSDISELLGFSALSGFSRWFHQQYGCSPTAWRRVRLSGETPPELSP